MNARHLIAADVLQGAAEAAAAIHARCDEGCVGCLVRRDILAVLTSTAHVLAEPTAGGFRKGRTYAFGAWTFECFDIRSHPDSGKPVAIGWMWPGDSGSNLYYYDLDQWSADWVDVTEGGS
ncbi:hypothetical protein [Streptomyces sp. YIM S03343]